MDLPERVLVTDVGPRDGLQSEEPTFIPTERKVAISDTLHAAGVGRIEVTSFVRPRPGAADGRRRGGHGGGAAAGQACATAAWC